MLGDKIRKVAEGWNAEDLELASPCQEKYIFDRVNKLVSKDIIQFYSTVGGIDFVDNTLFSFWLLEQMVEENKITNLTSHYLEIF